MRGVISCSIVGHLIVIQWAIMGRTTIDHGRASEHSSGICWPTRTSRSGVCRAMSGRWLILAWSMNRQFGGY